MWCGSCLAQWWRKYTSARWCSCWESWGTVWRQSVTLDFHHTLASEDKIRAEWRHIPLDNMNHFDQPNNPITNEVIYWSKTSIINNNSNDDDDNYNMNNNNSFLLFKKKTNKQKENKQRNKKWGGGKNNFCVRKRFEWRMGHWILVIFGIDASTCTLANSLVLETVWIECIQSPMIYGPFEGGGEP